MVSRVLGFLRDVLLARTFGSSDALDAFVIAFKIPNFFRRLFAEGAFGQAFSPVLARQRVKGEEEVRRYINGTCTLLGLVVLGVCVICMLLAPWVIRGFAPGFVAQEDKFELAYTLLIITFPYLFFISIAALLAAVLNAIGKFSPGAFAPIFLNVSLIAAALFGSAWFEQPIISLGWAVFVAGLIQAGWLWYFAKQNGYMVLPSSWRLPAVRETALLMVPALFGVSVGQVNLLVDTMLASLLVSGSVSWLYYADRMMELPLGVWGVAIGTVILPSLSQICAREDYVEYGKTIDWGVKLGCWVAFPAAVGLIVLSDTIIAALFRYGAFSLHDVAQAAPALQAYALGLPAFVLIKIFSPAFFARKDIKTPVQIAAFCMIINIGLNLLFMQYWQHVGLALATSASGYCNALLLGYVLHKKGYWRADTLIYTIALRCMAAVVVMACIALIMKPYFQIEGSAIERIAVLFSIIMCCAVAYFGSCWLVRASLKSILHKA